MYSLKDLCIQVAQKHVHDIDDIGDCPFELVKPILEKARPEHLIDLEEKSPHLKVDTQPLWKDHVLRDFGLELQKRNILNNIDDWRGLYGKLKKKRNAHYNVASAKLRSAYTKLEQSKQNKRIVPLEREPRAARPPKRPRPMSNYCPKSSLMARAKSDFLKKASATRHIVSATSSSRSFPQLHPLGRSSSNATNTSTKRPLTSNTYPSIPLPPKSFTSQNFKSFNAVKTQPSSSSSPSISRPTSFPMSFFPNPSRFSSQVPKRI